MSTGILDKHTIDTTLLDQDTYYPVVMSIGYTLNVRIEVIVALNSGSKPNWSTHPGGFSCRFIEEVNGWGWGVNPVNRTIYASDYLSTSNSINPIGGVGQLTKSSNEYIYVRGGGKYHFYLSDKIVPVLIKDTFTLYDESISPTKTPTFNNVRTNFLSTDLAPVLNNIEKKIDNIQIGGRNLLRNSNKVSKAQPPSGVTSSLEDGVLKAISTGGNGLSIYCGALKTEDLKEGDLITISYWAASPDSTQIPTFYLNYNTWGYLPMQGVMSSSYSRFSITTTYKPAPLNIHLGFTNITGTFFFKYFKIEKGNMPTDWTPAPEDSTYEEGTWTPVVEGSSTQGVAQYTVNNARYVRTGNMITTFFDTSGKFTTAPTGACVIKGLPYQGDNNTNGLITLGIGYAEQNVYFAIQGNTLVSKKQNGKNSDIVAASFGTDISNTSFHLYGNVSYFIG